MQGSTYKWILFEWAHLRIFSQIESDVIQFEIFFTDLLRVNMTGRKSVRNSVLGYLLTNIVNVEKTIQ